MATKFPFEIETFPVGMFQCNCCIIGCPETREAIIIDPGDEGQRIIDYVKKKNYSVKYILHTHAHLDHFGATAAVKDSLQGKVVLHKDDLQLYQSAAMQAGWLGLPQTDTVDIDHYIEDEEFYNFGKGKVQALCTPGHSPGSASFKLHMGNEQIVFSGDTLFQRSIGRTDLPGGDFDIIKKSIHNRLFILDGDSLVVPGHGPNTSIGEEKIGNPFV